GPAPEDDQPIGVGIGERAQQQRAGDAENRGVGAHTEREREHRRRHETAVLRESAQRIPNIRREHPRTSISSWPSRKRLRFAGQYGYSFPAMPELPPLAARIRASLRGLTGLRWLAIIWIVVFWRLGYASLLDPDEAHYAQLTREMIQARTWLVALLDGHPYIDKPVLYHWLQAAAVWLLGESAFALRLPSALSAVALISAVGWAG